MKSKSKTKHSSDFIDNILSISFLLFLVLFFLLLFHYSSSYLKDQDNSSTSLISSSDINIPNHSSLTLEQQTLCSNISNENKKSSCMSKYSTCDSDKCNYDKAIASNDLIKCNLINDSSLKTQCNGVVSHNNIFQNSVLTNNLSLCNTLQDNLTIVACKNNYYYVQAYNLGNKSLCDQISEEGFKNACKLQ